MIVVCFTVWVLFIELDDLVLLHGCCLILSLSLFVNLFWLMLMCYLRGWLGLSWYLFAFVFGCVVTTWLLVGLIGFGLIVLPQLQIVRCTYVADRYLWVVWCRIDFVLLMFAYWLLFYCLVYLLCWVYC